MVDPFANTAAPSKIKVVNGIIVTPPVKISHQMYLVLTWGIWVCMILVTRPTFLVKFNYYVIANENLLPLLRYDITSVVVEVFHVQEHSNYV